MTKKRTIRRFSVLLLTLFFAAALTAPASAQKKFQRSPGGYHGELDFPMSWKRYYSYDEWTGIMHDIQKKYPHLADIQSIGKSRMGRDQYLITITAKDTGKSTEKPAMWVDGAIHGNEVNGIMCSLYVMWYLLTRYDYDPYVFDIVNDCTFYIVPGVNVDANDSFVRFPNTPNNPREPYRPEDNDGDGLYDEDQTEDVDGDGELSTMYIVDPKGDFKLSPDKRRFIPVDDPREEVKRFRRIGSEGFDNDGDGQINEDDIGGPDPNRNFPYGWNLEAGNPYPMSEPECRNIFEFQLAHPNIFASFHYHNTGRLIMFQAPPALPSQAQGQQQVSGGRFSRMSPEEMLEQMRQSNKYAQLFDRQVAPDFQHDMDTQTAIVTMGARIFKNYTPTIGGLSGQAHAATYYMLGAYSYLIELWGSPAFDADVDGDGRVSDEETLDWIDIELTGEGWILPHTYDHPDLGEVWIGGSQKKHMQRTPPARYIEQEAFKNAQFVLYCASQFPKVEIEEVKVIPAAQDLFWIQAAVKNERLYPTSSDMSVKLNRAVQDRITISSSNNVSLVELPQGKAVVFPLDPEAQFDVVSGAGKEFRIKGKETLHFCGLVRMNGSNGWVEVQVVSKNGGTAKKRVNIKVGN